MEEKKQEAAVRPASTSERAADRAARTANAKPAYGGPADGGASNGGAACKGPIDDTRGNPAAKAVFRKPFPTPGDVFAMLGIVLGAQIVVAQLLGFAMLFMPALTDADSDPVRAGKIMALTYFLSMSLALGGILVYRRSRGGRGPVAHFSRKGLNPVLLLWALVLIVGAGIVIEPFISLLPSPPYESFGRGFWTVVSLVVLAPLFEETICRGILLGGLRARYGVIAAWLFSSLFFGVMHLYPAQVTGAFVIGLVIGFIYIATDSLWAAILLHAANNALAYLMLALGYGDADLADLLPGRTSYVLVYIAAAALTVVSGYMVWRTLVRLKAGEKNPSGA